MEDYLTSTVMTLVHFDIVKILNHPLNFKHKKLYLCNVRNQYSKQFIFNDYIFSKRGFNICC